MEKHIVVIDGEREQFEFATIIENKEGYKLGQEIPVNIKDKNVGVAIVNEIIDDKAILNIKVDKELIDQLSNIFSVLSDQLGILCDQFSKLWNDVSKIIGQDFKRLAEIFNDYNKEVDKLYDKEPRDQMKEFISGRSKGYRNRRY